MEIRPPTLATTYTPLPAVRADMSNSDAETEDPDKPTDKSTDETTDDNPLYPDVETAGVPTALLDLLQGETLDDDPFTLTYDYDHQYHFRLDYKPDTDTPARWSYTFKDVEAHADDCFALDTPVVIEDDVGRVRGSQFMLHDIRELAPTIDAVLVALAFYGIPQDLERLYRHGEISDERRQQLQERREELFGEEYR